VPLGSEPALIAQAYLPVDRCKYYAAWAFQTVALALLWLLQSAVVFIPWYLAYEYRMSLNALTAHPQYTLMPYVVYFGYMYAIMLVSPCVFAILIIVYKWTFIGKFRPGKFPLWGWFSCRLWLLQRMIQNLMPMDRIKGTLAHVWFLRLMGAKVGDNCHLMCSTSVAFDCISIDDNTSIGHGSVLETITITGGYVMVGSIHIGKRCFLGVQAVVAGGSQSPTVMEDDGQLGDQSLLPAAGHIGRGESWNGSPARFVCVSAPIDLAKLQRATPSALRVYLFTLGQLASTFLFQLVFFLPLLPLFFFNFGYSEFMRDLGWLCYVVFPIPCAVWMMVVSGLSIVALKWMLLGKYQDEVVWVYSGRYLSKWIFDGLMQGSLQSMRTVYATLYLPAWFRCLGAQLGSQVEVSTVYSPTPDMMHLDDSTFLADQVFLGVERIHLHYAHIGPVFVGKKTFVGNSANVPAHSRLGNNSLVAVLSTGPRYFGSSDDDALGTVSDLLSRRGMAPGPPTADHRLYPQPNGRPSDLKPMPRTGVAPSFFVVADTSRGVKIMIDSDDDGDNDDDDMLLQERGKKIKSPFALPIEEDEINGEKGGEGLCCPCCPIPLPWTRDEGRLAMQTATCVMGDGSNYIGSPGIRMPRRYQNTSGAGALAATYDPPAYVRGG
jgi:non-ribosomal peptide synthetase-like protein